MSRCSASVSRRVWRKTLANSSYDQILRRLYDMSENFGTPYSEYPNVENEINYDWAVPGYPQPSPFYATIVDNHHRDYA